MTRADNTFSLRQTRSGSAAIPMMQSANLRNRNNSAAIRKLNLPLDGRVSLQGQVRSRVKVVIEVQSEDAT